jgi:drug/metabolite transporter (DMT)-like permease
MSCSIAIKPPRPCRYACANAVYAMLFGVKSGYAHGMATLTSRNNLLGIAALCAGALVFSLQDSVIKAISGDHAVTLAIMLRAIVSFPVIVAMVAMSGGLRQLDTPHWKVMVLRGVVLLCAYTTYFMAFPALPLAEAIALYFMVPLLITVMSGPLLGERVTAKAWAAVAVGLVGVFVILKPGMGLFEPAALLSLVSAATYAYAMILARKHGANVPATVMTFYQNAVYLLGALTIAVVVMLLGIEPPGHPSLDFLVRDWKVPNTYDLALMGLCGIIAAIGSTLLSQAYRLGQASIVTPFEYTGMIWGVVLGFLFFNEVPQWTTVLGMLLIAAAGVLALRAEAKS